MDRLRSLDLNLVEGERLRSFSFKYSLSMSTGHGPDGFRGLGFYDLNTSEFQPVGDGFLSFSSECLNGCLACRSQI